MFKLRLIQEEDYTKLCDWWKWFRFPAPALEMLPNSGLVVSKGNIDICAGYIYFTNSKICWIEFIVSNPDYKEKDRKQAIQYLINQLSLIAKDQGYKAIYTNLKNESLVSHFTECEYIKGSKGTTEMIKVL